MRRVWPFLLMGLVILLGCQSASKSHFVTLSDLDPTLAAGAQGISPRPVLRVGAHSMLSPTEALLRAGPLFDYLGKELNRPVEIVVPRSYTEAMDLVRRGEVHLGVVSSYAYMLGQEEFWLEALAVPVYKGTPQDRSHILVRRYSGITRFSDLKGHTFAYTDPLSVAGRLYPEVLILAAGERVDRFFEQTIYTSSYDRAIKSLDQGVVDGTSVSSIVFDLAVRADPDLNRRLRIIESSEFFAAPPFVVHPQLGADLKRMLQEVLIQMDQTTEGREALTALGIERFAEPSPAWYESVKSLAGLVGGR